MKKLAFLTLLAIAALISSCGSKTIQSIPTSSTSGNWEAQLVGGAPPASGLSFLINFYFDTQNGNGSGPITINDFSFINANTCFPSIAKLSGTAQLNNDLNTGKITGSFTLTIVSGAVPQASGSGGPSTLTLTADPGATPAGEIIGNANSSGVMSNGAANGYWTMTNAQVSACNAGGGTVQPSFLMCQNAATCTTQAGSGISTPVLN
jgi:hypothetical protein